MVESESHQSSPWPVTRAKFLQKSRLQMSHNLKCVFVQISESLVQNILKLSETSLTHVLFGSVLFHLQVFLYFRLFFFSLLPSFIDSQSQKMLCMILLNLNCDPQCCLPHSNFRLSLKVRILMQQKKIFYKCWLDPSPKKARLGNQDFLMGAQKQFSLLKESLQNLRNCQLKISVQSEALCKLFKLRDGTAAMLSHGSQASC